ncbi:MAG: hypothetical protein KBA95_01875 [Acidobacteria bacterium]|nr:hypothetical protein [Acidobacteriota bacterium]
MSVIKAAKVYLGQHDLSGFMNQIDPRVTIDKHDPTTFGDLVASDIRRAPECGLETIQLAGKAFFRADSTSPATWKSHDAILDAWKDLDVPVSWSIQSGAAGEVAEFFRAVVAERSDPAKIGDLLVIDFSAESSGGVPLVRGIVLETGTKAAAGNSVARNLGVLAAGKTLYACLHVFEVTGGGTLTMKVQSDELVGFATPTDRITFAGKAAAGYEWKELAGPIAVDAHWRASWTLPVGTARFALLVGIL